MSEVKEVGYRDARAFENKFYLSFQRTDDEPLTRLICPYVSFSFSSSDLYINCSSVCVQKEHSFLINRGKRQDKKLLLDVFVYN